MEEDDFLTPSERKALDEAAVRFANKNHSLHNERIRPDGVNIFEWLSTGKNEKAFNEAREAVDLLGDYDD